MSSCIIYLDNYYGTLYPGNTIEGRVVCSFSSNESIREVRLKFEGSEHTEWVQQGHSGRINTARTVQTHRYHGDRANDRRHRSVLYTGDNKFIGLQTTLAGAGDISAGRHEYPFNFQLPKNLPGSFNNAHGWIKYRVKATVDRPLKIDYEDEKHLNIVAPINFNEMSDLIFQPVQYQDEKTICCCCCASDPITMDVYLDKEAFVLGETVKVKVDLKNMSNISITALSIKVEQTIKSTAKFPRHADKCDVELVTIGGDTGVGAHGQRTYECFLEIPRSTVVPNFNLCTLFEDRCTLSVEAILPKCHTNLKLSTQIKLGHIAVGEQDNTQTAKIQQPEYPLKTADYPPAYFIDSPDLPLIQPAPPDVGSIGFTIPMPRPSISGLSIVPNAPPQESAPSAPSKEKMAESDSFVVNTDTEVPPPTYSDSMK